VIASAARWPLRTLLLYAGDDRLVSPRGSRAFAAAAAASDAGECVRSACFATLYHEIFNEPDAAPVFATLAEWLDGT
jgi:alpha-beta hydrolase superfamily lysophospholipase